MRKAMLFFVVLFLPSLILPACNGHYNHPSDNGIKSTLTVVIDPGHGGRDVGAIGASGQYEKDFTLSLARKVVSLLKQEPNINVFMTRSDDRFISQKGSLRPEFANRLDADLFISIHGNTFHDPSVSGTETLYYHNDSQRLAKILQRHVVGATGFRDRGIAREDLFVVRGAEMPAVLIEVGFMTNPRDESQMWTDEFQIRVATSIVDGIKEYHRQPFGYEEF